MISSGGDLPSSLFSFLPYSVVLPGEAMGWLGQEAKKVCEGARPFEWTVQLQRTRPRHWDGVGTLLGVTRKRGRRGRKWVEWRGGKKAVTEA